MAVGNPRLAVWYADGAIRLFEYASGAFLQVTSTGGYTHNPGTNPAGVAFQPNIAFGLKGNAVILSHSITAANVRTVHMDRNLTLIGESIATNSLTRNFLADYIDSLSTAISMTVEGTINNVAKIAATGNPIQTTSPDHITGPGLRSVAAAPDGSVLFVGLASPGPCVTFLKTGTTANGAPIYSNTAVPLDNSVGGDFAAWTKDNVFLIVGDIKTSNVQVYLNNSGALTLIQELAYKPGVLNAIACSNDLRTIAVSSIVSGTPQTVLYKRNGLHFDEVQTLAGIGSLLDFSADGKLLVDAKTKKVFASDLVSPWAEVAGAGAAIFTGAVVQGMSTDTPTILTRAFLYDGALASIISGTADVTNFRFVFLTEDAAFNAADATPGVVTNDGAYTVGLGGFPGEGLLLTGVLPQPSGTQSYEFLADPLSRTIVSEQLIARYGLVFDVTNNKPVLFYDLGDELIVESNTVLNIQFVGNSLLLIGP